MLAPEFPARRLMSFKGKNMSMSQSPIDDIDNGNDNLQSSSMVEPPPAAAIAAATPGSLSPKLHWTDIKKHINLYPNQWTDTLRHVAEYLSAKDVKSLRLTGSKGMHLTDPSLTWHLLLRMDKASFFSANTSLSDDQVRKWLDDRRRLVINNVDSKICPNRVGYLVANGYLDSVTELIVFDCHAHGKIIALLAQLPNLQGLVLVDQQSDQEKVLDDLEAIVACVGTMHSLEHLNIEFDCTIHGSRLSCLANLEGLKYLRLRGFDLSDGINYIGGLEFLQSLHLCHGNFFSSPSNDVNEKDLLNLTGLTNLQHIHLEGFDCLTTTGLQPFSTTSTSAKHLILKHCQDMSEECLMSMGRMGHLTSLHIVNSAYDDTPIFDIESLQSLNALANLKSLSLFYVLEDLADLRALWGLASLETLNVALEDEIDLEENSLCRSIILPSFASLRKLRIFSEDGASRTSYCGKVEVEYASFNFGDLVYLE